MLGAEFEPIVERHRFVSRHINARPPALLSPEVAAFRRTIEREPPVRMYMLRAERTLVANRRFALANASS